MLGVAVPVSSLLWGVSGKGALHKLLAETVHGVKWGLDFFSKGAALIFGLCFIWLHEEGSPHGFGLGNAGAHSGCFAAASEMGFGFQGCLNKTEVVILLGVWENART